ncbi:hypothetical protein C1646_727291 [Rhizophagus diaphanus]|nr:hypothetical protein C1646_727291 [Rhizophagus diaphanus] [Rhizophagus sp. MUCL 43196]
MIKFMILNNFPLPLICNITIYVNFIRFSFLCVGCARPTYLYSFFLSFLFLYAFITCISFKAFNLIPINTNYIRFFTRE